MKLTDPFTDFKKDLAQRKRRDCNWSKSCLRQGTEELDIEPAGQVCVDTVDSMTG